MTRENTVNVPREPDSGLLSVIASMVRRIAVPTSIDPDEVYFDNGHARQIYKAITDAAPLHEGEGEELREGIARIIEPNAWTAKDFNPDWEVISLTRKVSAPVAADRSLKAADAILKLIASARAASPPSVEVERLEDVLAEAYADHQRGAAAPGDSLFDFMAKRIRARAALSRKQEPGVPTPGGAGE